MGVTHSPPGCYVIVLLGSGQGRVWSLTLQLPEPSAGTFQRRWWVLFPEGCGVVGGAAWILTCCGIGFLGFLEVVQTTTWGERVTPVTPPGNGHSRRVGVRSWEISTGALHSEVFGKNLFHGPVFCKHLTPHSCMGSDEPLDEIAGKCLKQTHLTSARPATGNTYQALFLIGKQLFPGRVTEIVFRDPPPPSESGKMRHLRLVGHSHPLGPPTRQWLGLRFFQRKRACKDGHKTGNPGGSCSRGGCWPAGPRPGEIRALPQTWAGAPVSSVCTLVFHGWQLSLEEGRADAGRWLTVGEMGFQQSVSSRVFLCFRIHF